MNIIYKNYKIVPCENAPRRFDLLRVITRRKLGNGTKKDPQGEEYQSTVDISLGSTLASCIEDIISLDTTSALEDRDVSILEYLEEVKKQRGLVQAEFNKLFNIKII